MLPNILIPPDEAATRRIQRFMSELPDSSERENSRIRGISISDTLYLALLPIVFQGIYLIYLVAFLNGYRLPLQLISVNISDVLLASMTLLLLLGPSLYIAQKVVNLLFTLMERFPLTVRSGAHSDSVTLRAFSLLISFLFFRALSILLSGSGSVWLTFAILSLLFASYLLTTIVRYVSASRRDAESDAPSLWHLPMGEQARWFGTATAITVLVMLLAIYSYGYETASRKEVYFVVGTNPEMVVLYMTHDRYYLAEFDRNSRKLSPGYNVREVVELKGVTIRREDIGPLILEAAAQPP